jgi:tRNA 2-thiouridine synthesizing protein A
MKEIEINGQKITVASSVDAVGLFCPVPIVKLTLECEQINPHQIIEVLADDPAFKEDVINWCQETKNKLLSVKKNDDDIFVAYVEKT